MLTETRPTSWPRSKARAFWSRQILGLAGEKMKSFFQFVAAVFAVMVATTGMAFAAPTLNTVPEPGTADAGSSEP